MSSTYLEPVNVTNPEVLNLRGDGSDQIASNLFALRKKNAALLASHYSAPKRVMEVTSVTGYLVLFIFALYKMALHIQKGGSSPTVWTTLSISWLLATLVADFFSGLVHWGADTWGTLNTPVVGKTFVRSFREHHVDPFRITCHDTIETNGDNCLITIIPLLALAFATIREGHSQDLFAFAFMTFLTFWVALTNQIHKWAHMIKPPPAVAFLQDWNIILSRKVHQVHHHTPFDRYYCITTGWLNPVLGVVGFWRGMEAVIQWATGAIPRQDDALWTVQLTGAGAPQPKDDEDEKEN